MNFILTVDSKTLNRVIKLKETEQSKTTPTRGCEIQTSFPLSWVNDYGNQNLLTSSRFSLSPEKQSSHHHRHVSQQGIEQCSAIETAISTQPSDIVIFFFPSFFFCNHTHGFTGEEFDGIRECGDRWQRLFCLLEKEWQGNAKGQLSNGRRRPIENSRHFSAVWTRTPRAFKCFSWWEVTAGPS